MAKILNFRIQPNKINWVANFVKVAPDTVIDDIKNYVLSLPTEILDDKNVINVGNNYIYHSDVISTFPIEFDIVDDLSGLPELLIPSSQLFQEYSDAFCSDVSFLKTKLSSILVKYTKARNNKCTKRFYNHCMIILPAGT